MWGGLNLKPYLKRRKMNSNAIPAKRIRGNYPAAASIRNVRTLTSIALLSAISFVLAFFELPVPLSPGFARMDISDFPALIGAMTMGPWGGVAVELVKNILGLLSTSTGGVGELANFLMGGALSFVAGMFYYKWKCPPWCACLTGSIAMALAAAVANYFILLPLFETFMPLDALIASFAEFIPFIHTKLDVVLLNAIPFNLLKGLGISLLTLMLYRKLTPVFRGKV